ncbi:MAG: site-specific DNA-methyltransferase [Bacteroidales bacterium]
MDKKLDSLTKEELINYIEELRKQLNNEKYGLYFDRKATPEDIVEECKVKIPILERESILDINQEGIDHILVEGDNFHVLSALNMVDSQTGLVDLIYIDPPYNTGNKDFVYKDRFMSKDDGYFHTTWLNFMEKRLILARNLLKESGAILISIDEHEFAQLKLLCDSVFGEKNFVEVFVYDKKSAPKGVPPKNMVASVHEYILCYAKDNDKFSFVGIPRSKTGWSNPDNDPRGLWRNTNIKSTVSDKTYEVVDPSTGNTFVDTWACSEDTMKRYIEEGRIIFPKNKTGQVRIKEYYNEMTNPNIPIKTSLGLFDGQWNTEMLNKLLNGKKFNNPKHLNLMKLIIGAAANSNAIIMDFFAGSGTTGHAVLELNKEDEGNRKFILCTNNENNIMHNVCYPRLKTVITGEKIDGEYFGEKHKASLKYFKASFVEDNVSKDQSKYNLVEKCDGLLNIKEQVYEKVGTGTNFNLYSNKENKCMGIYNNYFETTSFNEMLLKIKNLNMANNIIYYFSLDNNIDENIEKKVRDIIPNSIVKPIPSKIYEIYKDISDNIRRMY